MNTLESVSERSVESAALKGLKVGMVLHIEAKTAVLASRVQEAGAQVYLAASNPLSTKDDVVSALRGKITAVWARWGEDAKEYTESIERVLDADPDFVIDDGADCITLAHSRGLKSLKGGCEETTTGITRLRQMERKGELKIPMIAVNDALTKHLFDNRYGTGQSALDGLMRSTNLLIAGRKAVVVGFGWVGKGISQRLRGLGAQVTVCEVDPIKAMEAFMEGFRVLPALEAVKDASLIVTATGGTGVITKEHFDAMLDGTILANAGHFNVEVDMDFLESRSDHKREVRTGVTEYSYQGKKLLVIGEGRLVNLVAADGHPIEVMDMSFSAQFLGLLHLSRNVGMLRPGLIPFPQELDIQIAKTFLVNHGIRTDFLSEGQLAYLGLSR